MKRKNLKLLKLCIYSTAVVGVIFLLIPNSLKSDISRLFNNQHKTKKKKTSSFKNTQNSSNQNFFARKDPPSNPILYPLPQLLDFRHVQGSGEGIGFGTDYSTVALLLAPDCALGRAMPLIDLRVHHFDNNTYAANAGVGFRYIPSPNTFCEILGANVFYDFRQGRMGNYHQLGAGIEILGKRWEFRANGYFPIGIKSHKTKCTFDHYEGGFFAIHRRCEFTAYGYNAEAGYYIINRNDFSLYAAGGPYYLLRRCEDNTLGGEVRIRPQYKDYLALEFKASYDPVFKAVYQVGITIRLPLYQIRNRGCRPCGMQSRQVYQPIERFEIMPLGRRSCWERNF